MPAGGLRLSKWYLDCVAEDGTVFLGYSALLRSKLARVWYTSTTVCAPDGRVETRRHLFPCASPRHDGEGMITRWSSRRIGLSGTWSSLAEGRTLDLLDRPEGTVRWECLVPSGTAEVELRGERLTGTGYVERLEMTIPPWRLPIEELRWGRFISPPDWVVWIDWRGELPMSWALTSAGDVRSPRVADDSVDLGTKGVLRLTVPRVLREGSLITTALSGMDRLEALMPRRILESREIKWLSEGTLELDGRLPIRGTAVHELVRLPRKARAGRDGTERGGPTPRR